jgi:hypothetical protein
MKGQKLNKQKLLKLERKKNNIEERWGRCEPSAKQKASFYRQLGLQVLSGFHILPLVISAT